MGIRVLLVDDDDDYWELVQIAVRRAGLASPPDLQRVADGPQALDRLRDASQELPQLVILDERMPGMDGTEIMARMQDNEDWKRIPIGFMPSSDRRPLIREAYGLGASFFVVKPLAFAELTDKLRAIFEFWNRVAVPPPG